MRVERGKDGIESSLAAATYHLAVVDCGILHHTIDKTMFDDGGVAGIDNRAIAMGRNWGDGINIVGGDKGYIGALDIERAQLVGLNAQRHAVEFDIESLVERIGLDRNIVSFVELLNMNIDIERAIGSGMDGVANDEAVGGDDLEPLNGLQSGLVNKNAVATSSKVDTLLIKVLDTRGEQNGRE